MLICYCRVFSFACFFFSSRRRHTRCALVLEFRRVLFRSKAKSVFDVRKIAAGHPYAILTPRNSGSLARAAYFVYQPNPIDYVVYDLRDSMRVYFGKHPVTTKMKTVSGVVSSSLYETFQYGGADPTLSMQFEEIRSEEHT